MPLGILLFQLFEFDSHRKKRPVDGFLACFFTPWVRLAGLRFCVVRTTVPAYLPLSTGEPFDPSSLKRQYSQAQQAKNRTKRRGFMVEDYRQTTRASVRSAVRHARLSAGTLSLRTKLLLSLVLVI